MNRFRSSRGSSSRGRSSPSLSAWCWCSPPLEPPKTPLRESTLIPRLAWEGELPPQKWMSFYLKILTHFAIAPSLRLRVRFEVAPAAGIPPTQVEEIRGTLGELGLDQGALEAG